MELQFGTAANLLPLKTERPAPPQKRDDAASRFKDYFDGAQSAKGSERPRPADKPEQPEEPKEENPAEENPEEGADTSPSGPSAPVVVVAAPVFEEAPAPTGDAPIPVEDGEAKADTPVDGRFLRSGWPQEASAKGSPINSPVLPVDEARPLPLPETQSNALADGSNGLRANREKPVSSTSSAAPSVARDVTVTTAPSETIIPQVVPAASSKQAKSSPQLSESRPGTSAKVPTTESAPVPVATGGNAANDSEESGAHRDSARDESTANLARPKSRDLEPRFDARRLETNVNRETQQPVQSATRSKPRIDAPETAIRSIDIKSGNGDSAAASLGRFLISGATESTSANSIGTEASPVLNTTTSAVKPSGTSSTTPPSQTLSQLMSPSVAASDAVEAAAKVLSASSTGGRQQVTLQLDPPELGQLKLQIRMHQDAMTLRVDANSQAVAKLIESRLPELRDALATHGIRVDRSEVVVARSAAFDNQPHQQSGDQQSSNSQQNSTFNDSRSSWAEGGRFGGTGHGGSNEKGAPADGGASQDFESPLSGTAWFDANEAADATEMWIDLVA